MAGDAPGPPVMIGEARDRRVGCMEQDKSEQGAPDQDRDWNRDRNGGGDPEQRPCVLHLTADYPDHFDRDKTKAIRNFIERNPRLDYRVVALMRTSNPLSAEERDGDGGPDGGDPKVVSKRYWALPYGVFHLFFMWRIARDVRRLIRQKGWRIDAIHAHKLTFEGITGWFLSRWLGVPLLASTRGEAEIKILRFKPHYRPLIQAVLDRCERIYHVSAWFAPILQGRHRIDPDKEMLLPNFVRMERLRPGGDWQRDAFVTILHLDIYKKKGLDRLLPAFKKALGDVPGARLDIIGRGTPDTIAEIQSLIDAHGLSDRVTLVGKLPLEEVLERLPGYCAMVLPSHNETFGMVYLEAILSGVPILYSRQTGIDGYLDDWTVGVGVDPGDEAAITGGLVTLSRDQDRFRAALADQCGALERYFEPEQYVQAYNSHIAAVSGQPGPGVPSGEQAVQGGRP